MASALLFSTVNRGLQELAIFDVQDTLKGLAEPLIPQPFNQGKVFYRVVSVSGQHSTRSTTGQRKRKRDDDKGPGHEEVGNGQEAGDDTSSFKLDDDDLVALAQAVAKTTELHCVERTFACLGFQTFSHTHTANRQRAWTEDATRQLLNDLLKAPDWKWALKAWTCARNWRPDRPAPTPPPTFRVSLRFRGGTATRKPRQNNDQSTPTNLYNQLVSRISSFFLDHASLALPPSTSQPWKPSLQTYDLEIWVHINDDGIVMGLPLRPGRNVYRNTTQKQEKGGLREAAAWSVAKMGLNSFPHATVVLDPCCGLGTVIGQCKGIKGSSSLCFAGDLDEGVVVEAKKKLSDVDFLIWDFRKPPLRPSIVDLVISDLPFGKQHALSNNLYPSLSKSLDHVLVKDNGTAALLVAAKGADELLQSSNNKLEVEREVSTTIGAIETKILVLRRVM